MKRNRKRLIVLILAVVLGTAFCVMKDPLCMIGVIATAANATPGQTRTSVKRAMLLYREVRLDTGQKPMWSWLRPHNDGAAWKDYTNYEYRLLGIHRKYATVYVAYDREDRVAGVYEYD